MGEIKSTLEIIMEKTKDMTMSEDEKKEFKQREIKGKIGGLIQKYIDGIIDLDKFKIEITALDKEKQDMITQAVMDESISRIRLGVDNGSVLKILEVTDSIDAAPVKKLIADFSQELENKRIESEKGMMESLREKGISGSAVIPNPEADPEWINYLSEMDNKFEERLRSFSK